MASLRVLRPLPAQRNECAQPVIAQEAPSPDQHGDIDREEGVGEDWTADAHVGRDRPTKIARQQDRAEDGLMTLSKSRNSAARALMMRPAQSIFFETADVRVAD